MFLLIMVCCLGLRSIGSYFCILKFLHFYFHIYLELSNAVKFHFASLSFKMILRIICCITQMHLVHHLSRQKTYFKSFYTLVPRWWLLLDEIINNFAWEFPCDICNTRFYHISNYRNTNFVVIICAGKGWNISYRVTSSWWLLRVWKIWWCAVSWQENN